MRSAQVRDQPMLSYCHYYHSVANATVATTIAVLLLLITIVITITITIIVAITIIATTIKAICLHHKEMEIIFI